MYILSPENFAPLLLSLKLALYTVVILLIIASPVAWWLSQTESRIKPVIEAILALPIVLPPTVLGFYLLIAFSPDSTLGQWWQQLFGSSLSFSFESLIIASVLYSFPFVLQPIQVAFESLGRWPMETAAVLGLGRYESFRSIIIPLSRKGWVTGACLGFAHTIGEFGVVLMVGGNISGETRVVSIAIYDHVETLNFTAVHELSLVLLFISLVILIFVYAVNRNKITSFI